MFEGVVFNLSFLHNYLNFFNQGSGGIFKFAGASTSEKSKKRLRIYSSCRRRFGFGQKYTCQ